jgi:hypothetical protein
MPSIRGGKMPLEKDPDIEREAKVIEDGRERRFDTGHSPVMLREEESPQENRRLFHAEPSIWFGTIEVRKDGCVELRDGKDRLMFIHICDLPRFISTLMDVEIITQEWRE